LKAGDYEVNYEDGTVTFYTSQSGNTIKASYNYENGATYYLQPAEGKALEITKTEVQFSKNVEMYSTFNFQIWVYNPYDMPNKVLYQTESYKNIKDMISTGNLGQGEIPTVAELTQPIVVFPFDYVALKVLNDSQGAEVRITLDDNIKVGGELGTATFYTISRDE
jgi:hypothetical protein